MYSTKILTSLAIGNIFVKYIAKTAFKVFGFKYITMVLPSIEGIMLIIQFIVKIVVKMSTVQLFSWSNFLEQIVGIRVVKCKD